MGHHGMVTNWQLLRLVGGITGVIALAVFMTLLGLEQADKLSSVLSLFVTVAGFVLSLVAHVRQKPVDTAVARGGAIAAAGSVRNARARSNGGTWQPDSAPATGIRAEGGSIAAGGDVDGSSAYEGPR